MNVDELYTKERHESGAEMQVKDEFGTALDMYIKLAGMDSKLYRTSNSVLHKEVLSNPDGDTDLMRAKATARITIGWSGFSDKGEELHFTKDRAEQVYLNAPFIMDQIDKFISKRANFTQG